MIDDIKDKIEGQNACIAYIYFDYNDTRTQALDQVIRCILKQFLCRLNVVPRQLHDLYNESIRYGTTPDTLALKRCLISLLTSFSNSFVLLDALDECSKENSECVLDLICQLKEERVNVFCTSRINTEELRTRLKGPVAIEIKAHPDDVVKYLSMRLSKEWKYDEEFREEILDTLSSKAEGKLGHQLSV